MITFNINQPVRVKLTNLGRRILEDQHHNFYLENNLPPKPYKPPKEDVEGWSSHPLWYLMEAFGSYVKIGAELPFDTTIEIEELCKNFPNG